MTEPDSQHIGTEPLPPPSRIARIFFGDDGLRAGWSLLLFAVIFSFFYAAFGSIMAGFSPPSPSNSNLFSPALIFRGESAALAAALTATFAMSRIEGRPFTAYGLTRGRVPQHLIAGATFGLGLLSLLIGCLRFSGYLVFESRLLHGASILSYALEWSLAFVLVAFYEETLFRGYLQATLARGLAGLFRVMGLGSSATLGFWTSAVLLSFGFGAVHRQNAGESVVGVLAAGLIGLVFCFSLWRTRSLWWAIGFHAAWDWAESYLFGVYDSGTLAAGRLVQTHPQGQLLFSGGLTGPEGSVLVLPTLLLMALAIFITLRPRLSDTAQASPPGHIDLP